MPSGGNEGGARAGQLKASMGIPDTSTYLAHRVQKPGSLERSSWEGAAEHNQCLGLEAWPEAHNASTSGRHHWRGDMRSRALQISQACQSK